MQDLCNLIGWEQYNIGSSALLVSMLHILTEWKQTNKQKATFGLFGMKNRSMLIKNKLTVNL